MIPNVGYRVVPGPEPSRRLRSGVSGIEARSTSTNKSGFLFVITEHGVGGGADPNWPADADLWGVAPTVSRRSERGSDSTTAGRGRVAAARNGGSGPLIGTDHDFAEDVAGLQGPVTLVDLREREHAIHDRLELARPDQASDVPELPTVAHRRPEDLPVVLVHRPDVEVRIGAAGRPRDHHPTPLREAIDAGLPGLLADVVGDEVDPATVREVGDGLRERLRRVVDHLVCPLRQRRRLLRRGGSGVGRRTNPLCDLERRVPDPARGPEYQRRLRGAKPTGGDEHPPGGGVGDWPRGCRDEVDVTGNRVDRLRRDHDVLGHPPGSSLPDYLVVGTDRLFTGATVLAVVTGDDRVNDHLVAGAPGRDAAPAGPFREPVVIVRMAEPGEDVDDLDRDHLAGRTLFYPTRRSQSYGPDTHWTCTGGTDTPGHAPEA